MPELNEATLKALEAYGKEIKTKEMIEKGLSGQLGIPAEQFKIIYDKSNFKDLVQKEGFTESNYSSIMGLAVENFEKKRAQEELEKYKKDLAEMQERQKSTAMNGKVHDNLYPQGNAVVNDSDVINWNNLDISKIPDTVRKDFKTTLDIVSKWNN